MTPARNGMPSKYIHQIKPFGEAMTNSDNHHDSDTARHDSEERTSSFTNLFAHDLQRRMQDPQGDL
jgi:hypothetical protein